MTPVTIGPFVVGEKPAPLVYTFQDSAGNPIDLSGGYVARFAWTEHDGTATVRSATVLPGTSGQVQYTWQGDEFATAGQYTAHFWVGNGANRFAGVRLGFTVALPVGAVPTI